MNVIQYAEYFTYLPPILLSVGVSIGLYSFKRLNSTTRFFFSYIVGNLLIDLSSRILSEVHNNNLILFFFVGLLDILIFSLFYYKYVKKKKLIVLIGTMAVGFIIIEFLKINIKDVISFQQYSNVVVSFAIISMSLSFFSDQLTLKYDIPVYVRFFNFVWLFYFAFQLIFLLPLNFLINEDLTMVLVIWGLWLIVLSTFYSVIIYLIWQNGNIRN